MFSHVTIGSDDLDRAVACYDTALAPLGIERAPSRYPGPRPHFAPDYYGAYVRDPDGNKLHFVRRGEE